MGPDCAGSRFRSCSSARGTHRPRVEFRCRSLLCYGLTAGVTTAVIPVVLVESLGLRRFGSISGLVGLAGTIGIAGGPLVMGLIFDFTASYTRSFELGAARPIAAAIAALAVSPAEGVGAIPGGVAGFRTEI